MNATIPISAPTLLIDEDVCRKNILAQAEKCAKLHRHFRPHFKTHQSLAIGEWYKQLGVNRITVSSLQMANYFAAGGWKDITIAFPVNLLEIDQINDLAKRIELNILISDQLVLSTLSNQLIAEVGVFVEIESGQSRSGWNLDDVQIIADVVKKIELFPMLNFRGFLLHSGESYQCIPASLSKNYAEVVEQVSIFRARLETKFRDVIISFGDTPFFSLVDDALAVDEFRPGNAVFYDVMQYQIGSCHLDDIAVTIACPVVANYPDRNELIVYGGAIHFSKEFGLHQGNKTFGIGKQILSKSIEVCWGDLSLVSLSQEHGVVRYKNPIYHQLSPGDVIEFYPIHACLSIDCMPHYVSKTNGEIIRKFRYA
jgi:D-serine deaminase-like pyridoxal phosphate-dependent protein